MAECAKGILIEFPMEVSHFVATKTSIYLVQSKDPADGNGNAMCFGPYLPLNADTLDNLLTMCFTQLTVRMREAQAEAEAAGVEVVMDGAVCVTVLDFPEMNKSKVELARLSFDYCRAGDLYIGGKELLAWIRAAWNLNAAEIPDFLRP